VPGAARDTSLELHADIMIDGWRVEMADRSKHTPVAKNERLMPGTARLLLSGRVISPIKSSCFEVG